MKKNYPLLIPGRHPDRVLDAVKHDIRKYLKRERRRPLPEGVDFLDFDCRFGLDAGTAQVVHLSALTGLVDAAARDGARQVHVEIVAKPGHRQPRPQPGEDAAPAHHVPPEAPPDSPVSAQDPAPARPAPAAGLSCSAAGP